jgi:hypothetical protein
VTDDDDLEREVTLLTQHVLKARLAQREHRHLDLQTISHFIVQTAAKIHEKATRLVHRK